MYSELSTLLEYTYFYISKNITLYAFLLVFKIIESLKDIITAFDDFKNSKKPYEVILFNI